MIRRLIGLITLVLSGMLRDRFEYIGIDDDSVIVNNLLLSVRINNH